VAEPHSSRADSKTLPGIRLVAALAASVAAFTISATLLLDGVGLSLSILALIVMVAAAGPFSRRSCIPFGWWILATMVALVTGLVVCAIWFAMNFELGE
jgi:hypothetical protein